MICYTVVSWSHVSFPDSGTLGMAVLSDYLDLRLGALIKNEGPVENGKYWSIETPSTGLLRRKQGYYTKVNDFDVKMPDNLKFRYQFFFSRGSEPNEVLITYLPPELDAKTLEYAEPIYFER